MSTYKASKATLLFHLSLLGFLTLVGLALTVQLFLQVPSRYPYNPVITAFMAVWGLLLLWSWYTYLTTPFEIVYNADDSIAFRSALRRTSLRAQEITSIVTGALSPYFIRIRHPGGNAQRPRPDRWIPRISHARQSGQQARAGKGPVSTTR